MRQDLHSTIQTSPFGPSAITSTRRPGAGDELGKGREVEPAQMAGDTAGEALAGEKDAVGHVPPSFSPPPSVKGRGRQRRPRLRLLRRT